MLNVILALSCVERLDKSLFVCLFSREQRSTPSSSSVVLSQTDQPYNHLLTRPELLPEIAAGGVVIIALENKEERRAPRKKNID